METSKEIYDKMGEIFSRSTIENILSLRSDIHKLKVSKDEGISTYLSKASQIKGQLKDLREIVFDKAHGGGR